MADLTPAVGLRSILSAQREGLAALRKHRGALRRAAEAAPGGPSMMAALGGGEVAIIAEVKRRSPSRGAIAEHRDAASHARAYCRGGAAAVSVLTEGPHFGGALADLEAVAAAIDRPVLRKDFILDEVQLFEAKIHGASAALLIVRALDQAMLRDLHQTAGELGLASLVEVHTLGELDRALALDPALVGVNARDLETFAIDLAGMETVLRAIPSDVVAVAESGLATRADVERVAAWGADAALVGAAVSSAPEPEAAVRELCGLQRRVGRRAVT
jgi:indole-3-glycerol phosphate synthase